MEIITLTERELSALDPRGQAKAIVDRIKNERFETTPYYVERYTAVSQRIKWLQEYLNAIERCKIRTQTETKLPGYWEYFDEMCSKFGAQGGSPGIQFVREYYASQFSKAQNDTVTIRTVARGRDFLIKLLRDQMEAKSLGGFEYKPICGTYAGLPTGAEKGSWNAETAGKQFSSFHHLLPILPGVRRQRNKNRVINQDAVSNVRYIEPIAQRVRVGLKTLLPTMFAAWHNPNKFLKPQITRAIKRKLSNVEIDYTTMDEYYNIHLAMEVYLPVASVFLTPGEELILSHYITECFEQPVLVYPHLYTGKHNWLSGIALTQDAETVYSIALQIGCMLECGCSAKEIESSLIVAIGDDVLTMVSSPNLANEIMHAAKEECSRNAMLLSVEKCRVNTASVRFCRLVYEERARRDGSGIILGQYPTCLALNNIVNPESVPASEALALVATLDRLDVSYGAPDYGLLLEFVRDHFKKVFGSEVKFEDIAAYSAKSWWYRVYEEPYDIKNSPSLQMLKRMGVSGLPF